MVAMTWLSYSNYQARRICNKLYYNLFGNRDCWTRTNDPLVPNQMRYQTALNPDIKIGAGLNFYRHPHLNNRYSVTNVGNQYSQRSTVSWLMYAHPGAVFITKWISYGSLWHNLIVSFDTSTTLCHLGLDLDSNFQIVPSTLFHLIRLLPSFKTKESRFPT